MLTTERNQLSSSYPEPEAAPPEPSFSFPEAIATVIGFVQRRMLVIGLTFLIVTAMGVPIVLKLLPALYNATVTVLIDNRGVKFDPKTPGGIEYNLLEAQIAIITSEPIQRSVAKKLNLADDSEFGNQKPGMLGTLLGTPRIASDEAREGRALGVLAANLTAKRTGANWIIEISYKSRNAERAADVANAFADSYMNDEAQQSLEVSKRYREWLLPTINQVGDQLTELQRKISEFKAAHNIVEASDGRTVTDQQLTELGAQQIAARQRLSEVKVKLARVEDLIAANVDGAALEAAVTDAVKSDVFNTLRTKYLDKKKLERQFANRVGSNHEVAVRLRAEMDELRAEMRDELRRVAETYRAEVDASKRAEDVIQREISQAQSNSVVTNDKLVTLRKWEADYKALQEIYNDKQKEYRARLQQETFPIPPARVLTKATPPGGKDYRKLLVGLAVVPAAGLGLGIALAFFLEMMDDVFHTERQIQKALGVKCLAIVPILKETEQGTNSGWSSPGEEAAAARTILRDQTPLWSVSDSPFSYFAESVRLIKAAADLAGGGGVVKVIGLTSAVPNEGKSTIAASLAQAIAQSGSRVILVDCDLRNPSLTASLAPVADQGLVDVISGKAALNDVVWTDPTTSMTFLPTVMKSRVAQTNEILASDATKRLFDTLRLMYEYVIVDLSPLAPVVDVRATASLVDTYVFVVEWGRTHTSVVRRTLEGAPTVSENLLGVVLNKTDMKRLRRYDSHLSKYHEKGYYRY
jgi:succinoglycan biosynthesis transport protein ExoP